MPPKGTGRKVMDPVKAMIAQLVQRHIVTDASRPPLANQPEDVDTVEAQVISPTETLIRVKTHSHGTRYFHVKIREMM